MLVGLTPEQEAACKHAVVPVPVVRANDVSDACASMSTVLPLVVVVDEGISDADREALTEFTTACGAELVTLEQPPVGGYAKRLFDALVVAERRRVGARS
jgi:hypothetical protein